MEKPNSLRAAIVAAAPQFARDEEKLQIWVDEGRIRSTMTDNAGFQWEYTLNITITDMTTHPSVLFHAINQWCRVNQPDLVANPSAPGYHFDADIIDPKTVDLHICLKLTEQVTATANPDGSTTLQHLPEPDLSWLTGGPALSTPPANLTSLTAQPGTPP